MDRAKHLGLAATVLLCLAIPARGALSRDAADTVAIGAVGSYVTRADDTLLDVARRFDLGYTQLIAANRGIDPWLPGAGRHVFIPAFYLLPNAPRRGIVVNIAAQRLFYFPPHGGAVETFPIGIGVMAAMTPLGATRVVAKEIAPVWYPPPSIHAERPELPAAVPPGADNPLGAYALRLGWKDYLIHGTNKPDGVGRNVSHGCLHLYPEDIAALFRTVPVGTPVRVIDQPIETGWIGSQLFLAVHPSEALANALQIGRDLPRQMPSGLIAAVTQAAGDAADRVDWPAVRQAGLDQTGVPLPILGASSENLASGL
jgi:L,D-transpeptidase ErfK/SrfK